MRGLALLQQIVEGGTDADPLAALTELAKTFRTTDGPVEVAKRRTPGVDRVSLDELQVDPDYQRPPDWTKIEEMREHLRAGGSLPPIKVNRRHDGTMWITNGQHRAAALTLEGHSHHDAHITEKPPWEEQLDTGIVAKVNPGHETDVTTILRGAGAVRQGKRLILNLGRAGTVAYTPHGEWVGKTERGLMRVDAPDARKLLDRLDLFSEGATVGVAGGDTNP